MEDETGSQGVADPALQGGGRRAGLGSVGSSEGGPAGPVVGFRPGLSMQEAGCCFLCCAGSGSTPVLHPHQCFAHSWGIGQSADLRSPSMGLKPGLHTF